MICAHCGKQMDTRVVIHEKFACPFCHVVYEDHSEKPLGWLVRIAGTNGGIIPFDLIHSLALPDTSPACVATLIRIAATQGLQDPVSLREALASEVALAEDNVH